MDESKSFIINEKCLKEIPPIIAEQRVTNIAEKEVHTELLQENNELVECAEKSKRVWKVPWFILLMCLVQISMYFVANPYVRQHLLFIPERTHEYWRYITYMLLHSDVLHLTLNVCLQCLTGFCLEIEQSHTKVIIIYVIGGVAGSMATQYLQPQLSLMGASAGVYALLMSHLPHLVKNFYILSQRYLRIAAIIILLLSDVCFTTFHFLINHNSNPRICLEAHVAGAVAGLVFGFLLYSGKKLKKVPNARLICNS